MEQGDRRGVSSVSGTKVEEPTQSTTEVNWTNCILLLHRLRSSGRSFYLQDGQVRMKVMRGMCLDQLDEQMMREFRGKIIETLTEIGSTDNLPTPIPLTSRWIEWCCMEGTIKRCIGLDLIDNNEWIMWRYPHMVCWYSRFGYEGEM